MDNEFYKWFLESWQKTGGLVPPWTAGRILGISRQNFNDFIKRKKIDKYSYGNKSFVSLKDVVFLKEKGKARKTGLSVEISDVQEKNT